MEEVKTSSPCYILGISAYYHDSAACLIKDGRIVAAAQEERFTRVKHDHCFPSESIAYCFKEAGITAADLQAVAYYEKPFIKFERLLFTYLQYAPRGLRSFLKAMPLWLKEKIFLKDHIREQLNFEGPIYFTSHHEAHAASAFYPSPFKDAAILTMDGVGEWATASFGTGEGSRLSLTSEIRFPHSLGLLYSAFTYYCGFRVNSGEYKLMGLAPYGEPKYADLIRQHLIDIKDDGSFRLNMKYFNYCAGLTMTSRRFHRLFGGPPRKPETEVTQRDMDLAASIQAVTEEVMVRTARHVHAVTGKDRLCLAGGVALNCVGNGKILRETAFKEIWIQPAAGDAGGALGAALFVWHQCLEQARVVSSTGDVQQGSYLGPDVPDDEVEEMMTSFEAQGQKLAPENLAERIAELIDGQKVVGLCRGRMEFGPRALGGRSILADARSAKMQSQLNLKIKFRESFRPFAPSVLREHVQTYFDLKGESPYMLLVAPVASSIRKEIAPLPGESVMDRLSRERSLLPAITHVDYSARVQTVDACRSPFFARVLDEFYQRTGCPVLINTSFNIRGEPMVGGARDAFRCFMCTDMDAVVIGDYLFLKEEQSRARQFKKEELQLVMD